MIEIIENINEVIEIQQINENPGVSINNSMYECTVCEVAFGSIEEHILACHKNEEILFRVSNKAKNVSNSAQIVCKHCNTEFDNNKSLSLHMKMHRLVKTRNICDLPEFRDCLTEKDLWRCHVCEKYFLKKLQQVHEKSHKNTENLNVCPICNKNFQNQTLLDVHKVTHNYTNLDRSVNMNQMHGKGDVAGKYECQYCSKSFNKPCLKVRHEMIHTGERSYVCDVCQKAFRVRHCLAIHLRTHSDMKPYVCKICTKSFKSVSAYNHHLQTHSDELKYVCELCKKGFKTAVMLGNHRKIHSKPYNCQYCDRRFSSLFTVKKHMKAHQDGSDEKLKFNCHLCSACFGKKSALKHHFSTEHAKGVFVDEGIEYVLVAKN